MGINMERAFVISAQRTPVAKLGGSLKDVQPDDLLHPLFNNLLEKDLIPETILDEVIIGQAKQSQDQSNIARYSLLKAGLSESIPGYTVHRQCGSGMQAIISSVTSIKSGYQSAIIAGGVESMSTAPYYLRQVRFGYLAGNGLLLDPNKESQPGSQPEDIYGRLTMGITAEKLASDYHISREEQDLFALNSQIKAGKAIEKGLFKDEIVSVFVKNKKKDYVVFDTDEHPRQTTMEKLSKLKPVFKEGGTVTAGNSSGLNDGASLLLIVSEKIVETYGLKPMAEIVGMGISGVDPKRMGIGPVISSNKALTDTGLNLSDIGLIELNEAFAAQSLAVIKELNLPLEKVNVNGGAIALGHPIGNSGARICVTLIHEMKRKNVEFGLATLCTAGGQGITTIFKNIL